MRRLWLGCAILLGLAFSANAQSVQQSGSVTPGHAVKWTTTGVISDGGTASNGLLTSLGVTASGPGICQQSGPNTGALNRVCLNATATGGGISMNNVGGATGGFTFTLNGVIQGIATVTLPVTTGDAACFADTTGTLQDCGFTPLTSTLARGRVWVGNASNVATATATPSIGVAGSVLGTLSLSGNTSGTVLITPQAAAGSPTLTLPNASGTFAISGTSPLSVNATTGDITCSTCLTSSSFANPTASVGLSAVNGVATTAMRSDAAPALSQSIVPTWSGLHTFSASLISPIIWGGTGAASTLTLRPTSGVGVGSEAILFQAGSNGASAIGTFKAGNLVFSLNNNAISANGSGIDANYGSGVSPVQVTVAPVAVHNFSTWLTTGATDRTNIQYVNMFPQLIVPTGTGGIWEGMLVRAETSGTWSPSGSAVQSGPVALYALATSSRGGYAFGANTYCLTLTVAAAQCVSIEADTDVRIATTDKIGVQIADIATSTAAVSGVNAAINIGAQAGASGYGYAMLVSTANGIFPIKTTGGIIRVSGGTIDTGIDFTGTGLNSGDLIIAPNTGSYSSRNAANLATVKLLSLDASNVLNLYAGAAKISSAGIITLGTWQGVKVGLAFGGTNADLSATGGTSQVLQQTTTGAAITVGQLAASNLSNGTTGSGSVVLATAPTIVGGSITALTTFALRDTSAAFDVTLVATSTVTLNAGRTLTLDMGNVAHTIKFGTTANTITFPNVASDTVALLGATQSFTAINTFSNTTEASSSTVGGTVVSGGLAVAKKIFAATMAIGTAAGGFVFSTVQADTSTGALFAGVTKGIRIGWSSATSTLEGVDSSGTVSYQPLIISGSTLDFGIQGTSKIALAATGGVAMTAGIASTSKTTGTLVVTGGIGTSGATFTDTLNIITVANAATTAAMCWNSGTGLVTENGAVGTCTVSLLAAKNLLRRLTDKEGFDIVMAMEPWRYTMKEGLPTWIAGEQIGFIADYVDKIEIAKPIVVHNHDGSLGGLRYEQYTAALTAAIHYLKADNDNLKQRLGTLERKVAGGKK